MITQSRFIPFACLSILLFTLSPNIAGADWMPGFHSPGTDGDVKAMIVHDGELYIGGQFHRINGTSALGFAKWDGSTVTEVYPRMMLDMVEWRGDLYFLDSWKVFKWTGSEAVQLAANYCFECMEVWDDKLVVGGRFDEIEGVTSPCIAAWDGSSWLPLANGLDSTYGGVKDLACYGGDLIAAGQFHDDNYGQDLRHIARFDGNTWGPVSGESYVHDTPDVAALVVHDGDLYASCGHNSVEHVFLEDYLVNLLARWDGSAWHDEGSGLANLPAYLISHPDGLIVSGYQLAGGGVDRGEMFFYVDHILTPVAGGTKGWSSYGYTYTAANYQDKWHFGGAFTRVNYLEVPIITNSLATLDDQQWQPFGNNPGNGISGDIEFMAMVEDELYVGGDIVGAGTTPIEDLAIWDGQLWRPVAGSEVLGTPYAMITWNDHLIFSGFYGIFVLDQGEWSPWPEQPRSTPHAFLEFEGDLIAGAWSAGTVAQRWDGSQWQDMGNIYTQGMFVEQFLVYEGQIIAAGEIWPKSNICRWNGNFWEQWYAANETVHALAEYRGDLIIGGVFTQIGDNPIPYIARYHDGYWQGVGNGLNNAVKSLLSTSHWLYASGYFTRSGLQTLDRTAAWSDNGFAWVRLAVGTNTAANTMLMGPDGLFLGGPTGLATLGDVCSNGIALWTEDLTPAWHQPPTLDFALSPPYPNPFNPCTNIEFNLDQPGFASMDIYDARGRLVGRLLAAQLPAGPHHLQWDGCDDHGRQAAAGTYFARLSSNGRISTSKLTLVK